jgi:hypothetical protein
MVGVCIEMNRLWNDVVLFIVVAAVTMLLTLAVVNARIYMLTEDAKAIRLVAGCELWDSCCVSTTTLSAYQRNP